MSGLQNLLDRYRRRCDSFRWEVPERFNFGDGSGGAIGRSHWNLVRFSSVVPGCDNGLDDDGDSLIDSFDPECNDAFDQELSTDTDGDGLSDDAEILTHGTDPTQADSDGDGVSDADEINGTMSNPNIAEIFKAEAWVSDVAWQRIFRVDLDSGDRSVLTSNAVGAGPGIFWPYGMTIEPDGQLLYADFGVAGVYRVDPQTGDRNLVGGSLLLDPVQLAVEPAGTILVMWIGELITEFCPDLCYPSLFRCGLILCFRDNRLTTARKRQK